MNLADDGAAAGGSILAAISALCTILVAIAKWIRERDRRRRMASVPPSPEYQPPATDAAILARLDRAERHDALVAALFRAQAETVDTQRKLEVLRDECHKLALRVHALEGERDRLRTQLSVERQAVQVLREQLAHVEQERTQLVGDLQRALKLPRG